jgi:glycosyltransferase involved in cell wall biosynthesis
MSLKVAFIQNRVQRGGRFQVSSEMTRVLNERGIEPDFLCFQNRLDLKEVQRVYGASLKLHFKNIPEPKLPFEWNIRYFNKAVQSYLGDYDLVINSNNTSFGLKASCPILSYVHFPRKYRMRSKLRSIHFPEGPNKALGDIANDPFRLLNFFYRFDSAPSAEDRQISNSYFTAQCLSEAYSNKYDEVIYPPVNEAESPKEHGADRKARRVISLGRFSADKRQLEQIEIASKLPDWEFWIIGFVNEPSYFARCEKLVKDLKLDNVRLLRDASFEEKDTALKSASYFIHNLRNEPFGITSVQGIAAGCLPIVHNSGGQMEIVPFNDQRFSNSEEAANLLLNWNEKGTSERAQRVNNLQQDLHKYTASHFRQKFAALLNEMLQ